MITFYKYNIKTEKVETCYVMTRSQARMWNNDEMIKCSPYRWITEDNDMPY